MPTQYQALLCASLIALGGLSGCDSSILSIDDRPNDVKSDRIDLTGATQPAALGTAAAVLESTGAVLSVAKNLAASISTIAIVAGDGEESGAGANTKAHTSKFGETQPCSVDGDRTIDGSLNLREAGPEVDVAFNQCEEAGLTIHGHINALCKNSNCTRGNVIVGQDNNELSIISGSVSSWLAGVGDYHIRSGAPVDASLSTNLKIQSNLGNHQFNFVSGRDGEDLDISVLESGDLQQISVDGSLGFGGSSSNSQCGQGQVEVKTLRKLQLGAGRTVSDGQITLQSDSSGLVTVDFLNDGGVDITLADGSHHIYSAEELADICAF